MSLEDDTTRDQEVDIPNPVVNDLVEEIHAEPDAEYRVYVENYPVRTVGEPIRQATEEEMGPTVYPDVGALAEPENFEVGHVLMTSNMSGADRERFLRLKKFRKNAPWKRNRQLMRDVDKLPHGPGWSVETKELKGDKGATELVEFWKRDSLEWVKKIVRDKQLGPYLHLKPQRHYTNSQRTRRRRGEMWTGDLMWKFQDMVNDPQGTVIPYIISSDETHLSTFNGDKKAHPVYLTLGNIPKRIRRRISSRATVLIGYLPVPKLDIIKNQDQRCAVKQELFHRCLETLLAPLVEASKGGVEVPFFDGGVRKIYPALAAYIADFPEQCKIACVKRTHCPVCTVSPKERGTLSDSPVRDHHDILAAMFQHQETGSAKFEDYGLFGVAPFWESHWLIDVGSLLSPDLLHQLNKGMFKDHLTKWVQEIISKKTMDKRYKSMPEQHGIRHFKNGITGVSQWTGRELKEMAKVFLPIVSDGDDAVLRAARALLDFMYLAHSSSLTDDEIDAMDDALQVFHENKEAFVRLEAMGSEEGFSAIPKLHMMQHYTHLIRQLGTPDGFNTETSERLHIDFAKSGYRASNRVNPLKQMALYIQRLEAVDMHLTYLMTTRPEAYCGAGGTMYGDNPPDPDEEDDDYVFDEEEEAVEELDQWGELICLPLVSFEEFAPRGADASSGIWERGHRPERAGQGGEEGAGEEAEADRLPIFYPAPAYKLSKKPTRRVKGQELTRSYGTANLLPAIRSFLRKHNPSAPPSTLSLEDTFPIWSRARLFHAPPPFKPSEGPKLDVIRAQPLQKDQYGRVTRPAHFDTALVLRSPLEVGLHRYTACRVRAIFELPDHAHRLCPEKLVYVELFNGFSRRPLHNIGLHTAGHANLDGKRVASVFRLSDIRMSCHLGPRYNTYQHDEPLTLETDVLTHCKTFFFNIFSSYFVYELVRHWNQAGGPR
ncbi:hypothetical protein FS749_001363 [Ceratobasidium sp. UAMH 11750]|nr:hypothetical protein FS749_001363 [Ceratobasidium sp. UAMH 11750]